MPYNPQHHNRRSIRLQGYDYSQSGLYFITICIQDRECLFGKIETGKMILNEAGNMVQQEWYNLQNRFSNIQLHEFVIMPNHFHGIIEIVGATLVVAQKQSINGDTTQHNRATTRVAPTNKTIGDMIDAFKSITTVLYLRGIKTNHWYPFNRRLWQRNYYEHIIRSDESYYIIAEYITNNPAHWQEDELFMP